MLIIIYTYLNKIHNILFTCRKPTYIHLLVEVDRFISDNQICKNKNLQERWYHLAPIYIIIYIGRSLFEIKI